MNINKGILSLVFLCVGSFLCTTVNAHVLLCKSSQGKVLYSNVKCEVGFKRIRNVKIYPGAFTGSKRSTNVAAVQESDVSELRAGRAELTQALQEGVLRIASREDFENWILKANPRYEVVRHLEKRDQFVVLKAFELRGAFADKDAVVFLVPESKLTPAGNSGQNELLFLDNGACLGPGCGKS